MNGTNIQKITFKFPCDQPLEIQPDGIKLFGVGGMYLSHEIIFKNDILLNYYRIGENLLKL